MRTLVHAPRRDRPAGFTLFTVLMVLCVIAGIVSTYGRHVIVSGRGGMASPSLLSAREACHSGLTLARQSLLSGADSVPATVPAGESVAGISVTPMGDNLQVAIEAMGDDGLGARRTAEMASQAVAASSPSESAALPTLGTSTVVSLLANPGVQMHHVHSSTSFSSTELSGLYVVHPNAQLQLSDVVLNGAVISSSVLEQAQYGAYDSDDAPRLLIAGNLRIDPMPELPGLTIVMPDGKVSTAVGDARIQIHGDVVAHDVYLLYPGSLEGHVSGVDVVLAAPEVLDRVGYDRKPPAWSPALQLGGASEPVFFATVPPSSALGSLDGISNYWVGK